MESAASLSLQWGAEWENRWLKDNVMYKACLGSGHYSLYRLGTIICKLGFADKVKIGGRKSEHRTYTTLFDFKINLNGKFIEVL
jgi:hypothetical protein